MLAFVKALYDAGIPIIAGTDCTAGFCLHRELELYSEAGIPNAEVLRIATWARRPSRSAPTGSAPCGPDPSPT